MLFVRTSSTPPPHPGFMSRTSLLRLHWLPFFHKIGEDISNRVFILLMSYAPLLAGDNGRDVKDEFQNTSRWWMKCLEPTTKLTAKQYFWIWQNTVLTCWGTFGVSFLVGYLMLTYKPKPTLEDMLHYFICTAFLTPLLNWIICTTLMSGEVLLGRVAVVDSRELPWWPKEDEPHSVPFKGWRWWFITSDLVLRPSYYPPTKTWCEFFSLYAYRFGSHAFRAIPWIFVSQFTVVVFYVFSRLMYGNVMYDSYPQPQLLTSIQAVVIALFTTPVWARMVLANLGSKLVHDESYVDFMQDVEVHDHIAARYENIVQD